MKKHILPFRQVHLDFHTSPDIPGIGELFDKKQWRETLKKGHVDSITVFSKCHHGLSYHPTKVGVMHPHLKFDLLRAQIDACAEIGVKTPVYLSAGLDDAAASAHLDWVERGYGSKVEVRPGFKKMCFNSPYLEYLCEQIKEAAKLFPEANGIFLDIIHQGQCVCPHCMALMKREGLDASCEADRLKCAEIGLKRYYETTTAAAKTYRADMPVFHNSGHISPGRRDIVAYDSHLELESLPTGGWGYDHFPMSAAYCRTLGLDMLGMTGKFHTTWGEFGGFKTPDALRFECAAMIAQGAKCSVGDQLHPSGKLDESTYGIIGSAYAEVEAKEPFCREARNVADIALLSACSTRGGRRGDEDSDTGAARVLLESHMLFDVLDAEAEFAPYKVLIVPEDAVIDAALKAKIDAYLAKGGKLFICGEAAFDKEGAPLFDVGAEKGVPSEFQPDYVAPAKDFRPDFVETPFVMYFRGMRVKASKGAKSLGQVFDPYFNRDYRHFCSHQHTPNKPEPSGFDCGILNAKGNVLYLAHPVFRIYRGFGIVAVRQYVEKCLRLLAGEGSFSVRTNMPGGARVALTRQAKERRSLLHAFYGNTSQRGGRMKLPEGVENRTKEVEVIEELLPLIDLEFSVRTSSKPKSLTLEPQGVEIPFVYEDGAARFKLDKLLCHQLIALND